ncbi:MAG: peptidylprolyl isomerase [Xanthomonadales bacterium]|nr:peptidylprolyl isomerase [Xanthomonadales bacterium]
MRAGLIALLFLLLLSTAVYSSTQPTVLLHTSKGDITIELNAEKAPISTQNFIDYVNSGFYTDTIFHRVISHFMVQGGGFNADMSKKETNPPIKNEASNGLKNMRGSIAMARTNVSDSATAQFFINVQDNRSLDYGPINDGYAVFGKVIEGMDVVDDIRFVETSVAKGMADVPTEAVIIISAKMLPE